MYFNFFYDIFEYPGLLEPLGDIIGIMFMIPYLLFYIMSLTFTILIQSISSNNNILLCLEK